MAGNDERRCGASAQVLLSTRRGMQEVGRVQQGPSLRGWAHARRLQHPQRVEAALGAAPARGARGPRHRAALGNSIYIEYWGELISSASAP